MKISLVEATPVWQEPSRGLGGECSICRLRPTVARLGAGHGAPAGRDRNGIFFIEKEIYSKWLWRTRLLPCSLPSTEFAQRCCRELPEHPLSTALLQRAA